MDKLTVRAITAYYRSLKAGEEEVPVLATFSQLEGRGYVLLRDRRNEQLLAIYRCMNRGELKRLKRWPAELSLQPMSAEPGEPTPSANLSPSDTAVSLVLLDLVPISRKIQADTQERSGGDQADLF